MGVQQVAALSDVKKRLRIATTQRDGSRGVTPHVSMPFAFHIAVVLDQTLEGYFTRAVVQYFTNILRASAAFIVEKSDLGLYLLRALGHIGITPDTLLIAYQRVVTSPWDVKDYKDKPQNF